ncbi:MAG: hypothetical protein Q9228_001235 [Teloschistes exilis]
MADDNEEISEDHDAQPDTTHLAKADRGSAAGALPQASSTLPLAPPDPSPSGPEISAKTGRLGSQPMTTTSSASSTIHSQARNAMDDQGPAPYGTRSRNRVGNARPNYAEDRELDMDYEWAPASNKTRGSSTSASSANLQGDENEGSAVNTRRRSLTTATPLTAAKGSSSAAPKDPLPGMSSFSVHSEPSAVTQQPSKKRKAPGAVPTTSTANSSNHGPTANHSTSRKAVAAPPVNCSRTTNMLTFETSQGFLKNSELIADDGTVLAVNGTGKCQIRNRHDIGSLDDYRKIKDNFWYEKMFDRYIHRYYEVIPTNQVINVPARVKKVLDERWRFVIVEQGRGKELTSAIKTCKRCAGYSASNDSVDCAICKSTYHMSCVQPALSKKPARGFAWACGPCSRKQERKLEARNIPTVQETPHEDEEEEVFDEEEEEHNGHINTNGADSESLAAVPRPATAEQTAQARLWPYRYLGIHCRVEDALDYDDRIYPRASSRLGPKHQANVTAWHGRPVELVKPAEAKRRYLKGGGYKKDGKLGKETVAAIEEDKSSKEKRPKWVMDEPQGYIHRGEDLPNDNPKNTARVQFRMPEVGEVSTRGFGHWISDPLDPDQREQVIDEYMSHAKANAPYLGVEEYSTNFLDKALELLYREKFDVQRALTALSSLQKRSQLGEPELTKEELKRFEEGVAKYGSELRNVSRYVGKSRKHGEIVRFYYMWKKTPRGKQIWGNYEGRKGKKQQAKQVDARLVDDVADDVDDSAFDNVKASHRKRRFECKFCAVRKSPQWRRAPGTAPGTTVPSEPGTKNSKDKADHLVVALCQRCAGLWRNYGIQWEDIDEVAKKVANSGGRAWRRKQDEEFLVELINANEMSSIGVSSTAAAAAASVGVEVPPSLTIQPGQDLSKKRQKVENQTAQTLTNGTNVEPPKKKPVEKPLEPLVPEPPVVKILPCAVCYEMEPMGDQRLVCRHCRLTVHRSCYGIASARPMNNWSCDTCFNDTTPQVSTSYDCVLCPVTHNEQDLLEPPKVSHKKKTDREREKERLEREMVIQATEQYRRRQDDNGRPRSPREPFKRTSGNYWVHITCALWHPEIKFSDATILEASEGFQSIPAARYEQVCKLCKTNEGACVSCHQCAANFHVACAIQYGYRLGFDVTPVKGSRKDVVSTVTMGSETGNVTAVVYCREHTVKSIVHPISEAIEDSSFNALQLFARTYKQADLSLTGTVRKAAMMNSATRSLNQATISGHRGSISAPAPISRSSRVSPAAATVKSEEFDEDGDRVVHLSDAVVDEPKKKVCSSCSHDASPKWHRIEKQTSTATKVNTQEADEAPPVPTDAMVNGASNRPEEIDMEDITPLEIRNVRSRDPSPAQANDHEGSAHTFEGDGSLNATFDAQDSPIYHCHKCHLMKNRNPPSPPVTDNGMGESQLESRPVNVETPSPPPPPPPPPMWPIPPPGAGHDPYSAWSGHSHPHFQGPARIPNGIPPSPPSIPPPPPPPQHFVPPPEQFHHAGFRPQPSYHEMPVQHPMNGVAGPYHVHRTSAGHLATGPYPSHHPPPPQAHHPAPSRDAMSPRMQQPPMNGPHGPPRAEENPFAVPYSTQLSPRQDHQHIYGGPHGSGERPETPPGAIGRGGMWTGGDGPLSNGASASPSLRNLLHH